MELVAISGQEINLEQKKVVSAIAWNSNISREMKLPRGFTWCVQFIDATTGTEIYTARDIATVQISLRHCAEIAGFPRVQVRIISCFPQSVKLILETRL